MGKKKSIKINAILNIIRQCGKILFPLITFPYVSRVLQAENYGKVNFGNSIVTYFSLIAALGITNYAIREGAGLRDDKEKLNSFANQVFTINIITTVLSYCLLGIVLVFWNQLYDYRQLILIQSMSIFLTTIGIEWLYSIYEDYLYITVRSLAVQVISLILTFSFVKSSDDYFLYAFITVIAAGGGDLLNLICSRKYIKLRPTIHPNFRKHLKPMLILFCNAIMISIYVSSDTTLLGILKDDTTVGIYSVAVKIYTLVKNVLNAIVVVSLPRLSYFIATNRLDDYRKLGNQILKTLLVILMPALTGLFMVSENVVLIISGASYISGQNSLKILCIALGFSVVASFFTTSILLPNKQEKKVFIATLVSSAVNLILNFILIPVFSLNGAAFTTALAEGIVMLFAIRWSKDYFSFDGYKNVFLTVIVGCVGIIVTCCVVNAMNFGLLVDTILKVLASVFIYLFLLLVGKNEIIVEQFNNFLKKINYRRV